MKVQYMHYCFDLYIESFVSGGESILNRLFQVERGMDTFPNVSLINKYWAKLWYVHYCLRLYIESFVLGGDAWITFDKMKHSTGIHLPCLFI